MIRIDPYAVPLSEGRGFPLLFLFVHILSPVSLLIQVHSVFHFFQIRIDRKNKRLLKQEIDLSNKSNELFRLRDNLRNKQDRLEALSIQLSEKNEKLNELDSREQLV